MISLKKYKWLFCWLLFSIGVSIFITYIINHISEKDINSALLQFGAILIPLFAAIIIMLQNNAQINTSTSIQLAHFQKLNDREIEEMQKLFQRQIDVLIESTNRQIEEFRKLTNEQIVILQENTNRQIQSNVSASEKIVRELTDNSVLLGEILKTELEKSILQTDQQIDQANQRLKIVKGFVLGRTEHEKNTQIAQAFKVLEWLTGRRKRLYNKYKELLITFQE